LASNHLGEEKLRFAGPGLTTGTTEREPRLNQENSPMERAEGCE